MLQSKLSLLLEHWQIDASHNYIDNAFNHNIRVVSLVADRALIQSNFKCSYAPYLPLQLQDHNPPILGDSANWLIMISFSVLIKLCG